MLSGSVYQTIHLLNIYNAHYLRGFSNAASMSSTLLSGYWVKHDTKYKSVKETINVSFLWTVTSNVKIKTHTHIQYIPRNMHTVFALLCFVVVIHWLIFPYPSGLLHWHCGNLTIAPVPAKQPWWIWINTSCESIMNDCITTTKQSTTKTCAYFYGYTVQQRGFFY